jgi:hypothetical protein
VVTLRELSEDTLSKDAVAPEPEADSSTRKTIYRDGPTASCCRDLGSSKGQMYSSTCRAGGLEVTTVTVKALATEPKI